LYVNIQSVHWETAPPLSEGSPVEFLARFLGRNLRYTYEIVEFLEGRRLVMRTAQGPIPMETTYEWSATPDDGTQMFLCNRGEPTGFSKFASPLVATAMRRANRNDLQRLKAILERGLATARVRLGMASRHHGGERIEPVRAGRRIEVEAAGRVCLHDICNTTASGVTGMTSWK
jgi:hypothetical protein